MESYTPLRYPGGKAKIYDIVRKIIKNNELTDKVYVEPYSGGFGLGLKLLLKGDIKRCIINDFDYHIFSFWKCVFSHTDELIVLIRNTNITIDEWHKQKNIYVNYHKYTILEVAYSTLFLNRTNYSGILMSGPIGGFAQKGKYKMTCRFNKESIIETIKKISEFANSVEVYNLDACKLLDTLKCREQDIFYNFDPPYVNKAKALYLNAYNINDHIGLMKVVSKVTSNWIMTYDNTFLIKDLYKNYKQIEFGLSYSVRIKRHEKEIMISSRDLNLVGSVV